MISPLKREARATASAVFPEAVGPHITGRSGRGDLLAAFCIIVKIYCLAVRYVEHYNLGGYPEVFCQEKEYVLYEEDHCIVFYNDADALCGTFGYQ